MYIYNFIISENSNCNKSVNKSCEIASINLDIA